MRTRCRDSGVASRRAAAQRERTSSRRSRTRSRANSWVRPPGAACCSRDSICAASCAARPSSWKRSSIAASARAAAMRSASRRARRSSSVARRTSDDARATGVRRERPAIWIGLAIRGRILRRFFPSGKKKAAAKAAFRHELGTGSAALRSYATLRIVRFGPPLVARCKHLRHEKVVRVDQQAEFRPLALRETHVLRRFAPVDLVLERGAGLRYVGQLAWLVDLGLGMLGGLVVVDLL